MKIVKIFFLVILLFSVLNHSASAAGLLKNDVVTNIGNSAKILGNASGYADATADSALIYVQTLINIFISIIGVLLLIFILYGGYNWLTAQGEEEKVTKAKDTIKRAIVGMIIIVGAYAISYFVITNIEQGTLRGGGDGAQIGVPLRP